MSDLSKLSDQDLLARLEVLVENERVRLAEFLAHLAEADRRIATRSTAWPSTFAYCTRKLGYSEDEAYRRITAARAAHEHPEIYTYIRDGKLSLTAICRLSSSLKGEPSALLESASNKPIREIEKMVAPEIRAAPPRIRPILMPLAGPGPLFEPPDAPAAVIEAHDYSFRAPKELHDLIERSKELLWTKTRDLDAVLMEWGREWLQRHDPLRKAEPKATPEPKGDQPPGWARNVVWKRDGGRCAYVAADGTRCETRRGLEVDHVVPRSLGGGHAPENLRLLCRPHNDSERRRVLGEGEDRPIGRAGPFPS